MSHRTLLNLILMLTYASLDVFGWCYGSDPFCNDNPSGRYRCGDNYECKMKPGGELSNDDFGFECTCQLKAGIIAAIVISCVFFTGGVCTVACVVYRKRAQATRIARERELAQVRESLAPNRVVAPSPAVVASPSYLPMQSMSPGGPVRPATVAEPVYRPTYVQPQQPSLQPYSPYTTQLNPPGLYIPPPSFVPNAYPLPTVAAAPIATSSGQIIAFCSQCGKKAGSGPFCSGCGFKLGGNEPPPAPPGYSTNEGVEHPMARSIYS